MIKTEKQYSWFQGISSFVCGLSLAYLSSSVVQQYTTPNSMPLVISVVAISGDKIGHFFIYKFQIEEVLKAVFEKYIKK